MTKHEAEERFNELYPHRTARELAGLVIDAERHIDKLNARASAKRKATKYHASNCEGFRMAMDAGVIERNLLKLGEYFIGPRTKRKPLFLINHCPWCGVEL